jgi:pimeloyl-ACP methyl ester carboxylesterase
MRKTNQNQDGSAADDLRFVDSGAASRGGAGREHRWTVDGLTLFARDYPGRTDLLPVICIPGLTRNSRDFEDLAPLIAEAGRRVIALDLRGRGASDFDPKPKRYAPATYVRDVVALMKSLGISRANFVGTSLGGIVTMMLAAKKPKAVAGAMLNDIGPRVEKAGIVRIASYVGKQFPLRDWSDAVAYAKETNGIVYPKFSEEDWLRFARRIFNQGPDGKPVFSYDPKIFQPISPLMAVLAPILAWRAYERLARVAPVLVVRGELSDILSLKTVEKMRRRARAFSFAEIGDVGHAPTLSEPAAWAAIRVFLDAAP